MKKMGIVLKEKAVSLDLPSMMAHKSRTVTALCKGIESLFTKNDVLFMKGSTASIQSASSVLIDDGETQRSVDCKHIVLATGSEISGMVGSPPPLVADGRVVVTSDEAIALEAVPEKLVVVGGGIIGLELGSVWQRLGAQVEVIEYMDRICPAADRDVSEALHKALTKQGLKIRTQCKVVGSSVGADSAVVEVEDSKGSESIEASRVLLCVGRKPFTKDLGLHNVGISTGKRGEIEVDSMFRTKVPNIYAIGDLIPGPMLAHKAEDEGHHVAEILGGNIGESSAPFLDPSNIPSVVYTHPEAAWVGLTEEEAKKKNIKFRVGKFPFMANSRARCNDDVDGFVKVIAEEGSGRLVGGHIVHSVAGEMVGGLGVAIRYGGSVDDVSSVCTAHPTLQEAVKEACFMASGHAGYRAIHY